MFRWKQQIDQEMLSFGYNRVFPIILNLALNMKFKTVLLRLVCILSKST